MNLRFMNNPLGELNTSKCTENDLDVVVFTRYRGMDKHIPPITLIRFTRYNSVMTLEVSSKSVNNLYPPMLCNLAQLAETLYALLRNPKDQRIRIEYDYHLSRLKDAMWCVYTDKQVSEQYRKKYGDIYNFKYGWNLALMETIFLQYAKLIEPHVTSSSQRGVSAYEKARNEGEVSYSESDNS